MVNRDRSAKRTWRLIWLVAMMSLASIASVQVMLRSVANAQEKKATTLGTAQESGVIQDDPTIAPDPQESADNNVTFPVDI